MIQEVNVKASWPPMGQYLDHYLLVLTTCRQANPRIEIREPWKLELVTDRNWDGYTNLIQPSPACQPLQ